jgi:hypothetical protein
MRAWATLLLAAVLGLSCSDPATTDDAGVDSGGDDAGARCAADSDCDDGMFCNGTESCAPEDPSAGSDGCVAGGDPCAATCSEEEDRCLTPCDVDDDVDEDGEAAEECGGSDCDDNDPLRASGNAEICDANNRDEDCDPTTIGPDADGDDFVQAGCCNTQSDGTLLCGDDCRDDNLNIAPGAPEVCDGRDNDCENGLDFPGEDDDGDGWADCVDLPANLRDCNDANASVNPGAPEICDGLDSDCGGGATTEDQDADGQVTPDAACEGGLPKTDCDDDDYQRFAGAPEFCDGEEDDCDSAIDESCGMACDPATESAFLSVAWIDASLDPCVATCGLDPDCVRACLLTAASVGPTCEVCARALIECTGDFVLYACYTESAERCRTNVCGTCVNAAEQCSGQILDGCAPCEDSREELVERGIGALALCQTATCTTPECIVECARERLGLGSSCASSCFADFLTCKTGTCAGSCGNPAGYNCRTCLDNMCVPALEACSGADLLPAACTMTEAQRLRGVASALRTCTRSCSNDGCAVDCVIASADPTPISDGCVLCYRDVFECSALHCLAECTGTDEAACDACICTNCEEAFLTCSGFRDGLCP